MFTALVAIALVVALMAWSSHSEAARNREKEATAMNHATNTEPPPARTFPVLRSEMLEPVDAPISKRQAVSLFKYYMTHTGYSTPDKARDDADVFTCEMDSHEENLRHEAEAARASIDDSKVALQFLRRDLKAATSPEERDCLQFDIEAAKEDLQHAERDAAPAIEALRAFKHDHRAYLIAYVNQQVHGDPDPLGLLKGEPPKTNGPGDPSR